MSDLVTVREHILAYLKAKLKKFSTINKKDKTVDMFSCPICSQKELLPTAMFVADSDKIYCTKCGLTGTIVDLVPLIEKDKAQLDVISIENYLLNSYKIKTSSNSIEFYLSFYEKMKFDLVPIIRNQKVPFEKDWGNKEHKNVEEWRNWIVEKYNLGVKTGKKSNITVLDFDTKDIPDIFKTITTMRQHTPRGIHYLFQYEEDLPTTRIDSLKLDILNDGKQFIVHPSVVAGEGRTWEFNNLTEIPKMPQIIKDFVKSNSSGVKLKTNSEIIMEDIQNDNISDVNFLEEGKRNSSLIKLGGILKKRLNSNDTKYVIELINRAFVKPSLGYKELNALVGSLDKYIVGDESELCQKIIDYLRYAEEGTSRDIEQAIGEKKDRIDKALSTLIRNQLIVKRGRMFYLVKKMNWREDFPNLGTVLPFKVPFFHDIGTFCWGDMILLGSKAKYGKTTIAMNIIRDLVSQGIKPNYICLETGSRFIKTACALGMKEGDFAWTIQTDPSKIDIEKNSVTIIDWLLIKDKSETDSVMQYFVEQLIRTNSFLIIFMQLKADGTWFAPNMVEQFPSMSARYLYENAEDGTRGYWEIDSIREAKKHLKGGKVPCIYLWDKKKIVRVDELEQENKPIDEDDGELAI